MKLIRDDQNDARTLGTLQDDDGTLWCQTLELPWRENQHGVSCIPPGMYEAVRFQSPHIGYELFQLQNVPGRAGIDIHIGNTVDATQGCILLGTHRGTLDGRDAVLESHAAFDAFMQRLQGVDKFTLTITTPQSDGDSAAS